MESDANWRVLLDLSNAALGYCGIPQESRLLFKALTESPGVDTSGLLFGLSNDTVLYRPPRNGPLDRRVERQAVILNRMFAAEAEPATFGCSRVLDAVARQWDRFHTTCRILFGRGRLTVLDADSFWDVIWRRWLSKSLTAEDIGLARRPMHLSDLSIPILKARAYLGLPGPPLDTTGFDFAVFHAAHAVRVSPETCKVVRHYDMIPTVRPDMVTKARQIRTHTGGVRACRADSIFACISEPAREDLVRLFPDVAERAVTIPCTLSDAFFADAQPALLPTILTGWLCGHGVKTPASALRRIRQTGDVPPYLLMVSTIEPRKNHVALVRAMEQVLARRDTDLALVVVGAPGWLYGDILHRMGPLVRRGRLFHLDQVPIDELRVLYNHARAVAFPSLYEGFGYSPLEAMCCGTPVIVSDIAAHRWAYGDAAEYCDPYRVETLSAAIEKVCLDGDRAYRTELASRGFRRVKRYQPPAVAAQWRALFSELKRQGVTARTARTARLADLNQELRQIETDFEAAPETATPLDVLPFAA